MKNTEDLENRINSALIDYKKRIMVALKYPRKRALCIKLGQGKICANFSYLSKNAIKLLYRENEQVNGNDRTGNRTGNDNIRLVLVNKPQL